MPLIDSLQTIAAEADIAWPAALNMTFVEFAHRVAATRALRDSKTIALRVLARGKAAA